MNLNLNLNLLGLIACFPYGQLPSIGVDKHHDGSLNKGRNKYKISAPCFKNYTCWAKKSPGDHGDRGVRINLNFWPRAYKLRSVCSGIKCSSGSCFDS